MPVRKRAFTVGELLVLLGCLVVFAAVVYPIVARWGQRPPRTASCQSNLKQLALGFKQYVQDYDNRYPFPGAGGTAPGWGNGLMPYTKSTQILQCPADPHGGQPDPAKIGYTDYWFNRRLRGRQAGYFTNSGLTIILGEGNDGTDATDSSYSQSNLPVGWLTNTASPLYRHLEDGANYAFTDGHVKWYKPTRITSLPVSGGAPTFSYK